MNLLLSENLFVPNGGQNQSSARPITREDIELNKVYSHHFSEKGIRLFLGDVSYELVEDGLDIAIINKSLTTGESQRLHLEDITPSEIIRISKHPITRYHLELALIDYINDHRFSYAIHRFREAGLKQCQFKKNEIELNVEGAPNSLASNMFYSSINNMFFLGAYIAEGIGKDFNYIKAKMNYPKPGNHWEFRFNLADAPYRKIKWNDQEGIADFIRLAKEDLEVSQIEFALSMPDTATQRVEDLKRYEGIKEYLISYEVASGLIDEMLAYLGKQAETNYFGWRLRVSVFYSGIGNDGDSEPLGVKIVGERPYSGRVKDPLSIDRVASQLTLDLEPLTSRADLVITPVKSLWNIDDDFLIVITKDNAVSNKTIYALLRDEV